MPASSKLCPSFRNIKQVFLFIFSLMRATYISTLPSSGDVVIADVFKRSLQFPTDDGPQFGN
jgi:hypothetical protein